MPLSSKFIKIVLVLISVTFFLLICFQYHFMSRACEDASSAAASPSSSYTIPPPPITTSTTTTEPTPNRNASAASQSSPTTTTTENHPVPPVQHPYPKNCKLPQEKNQDYLTLLENWNRFHNKCHKHDLYCMLKERGSFLNQNKNAKILLYQSSVNLIQRVVSNLYALSLLDQQERDLFEHYVIDDASDDECVVPVWRAAGSNVDALEKPLGSLTASWNAAFKHFADEPRFETLIVCNNDVLIPRNSITELTKCMKQCSAVGLLSTWRASPCGHCPNQLLRNVLNTKESVEKLVDHPQNYQLIQDWAQIVGSSKPLVTNYIHGFCFAISRRVFSNPKLFHDFKKKLFWDPKLKNLKQEDDLKARFDRSKEKLCTCPRSFAYHFKGSTLKANTDRDNTDLQRQLMKEQASKSG